MKKRLYFLFFLIAFVFLGVKVNATEGVNISYTTHVQNIGWQSYVSNGVMAGTSGQSLRLEGIKIKLINQPYTGDIEYRTHIQNIGWETNFKKNDEMSGTSGLAYRLEAIEIKLTGEISDHYDVYYRVHAQNFGWLGWARNGEPSGTAGFAYRLEGIEIKLIEKGTKFNEYGLNEIFVDSKSGKVFPVKDDALISYKTHVQNIGWQNYVVDGQMAGTSGQALRLEGIKIKLLNQQYSGNIEYRTHIQNIGWESSYKKNDEMSGTSGLAYRLEAIEIKLTGEMADHYDVYYRVHAQNFGWLGWAKNGSMAGTAGYAYRLEGIEIRLIPKGEYFSEYRSEQFSFYNRTGCVYLKKDINEEYNGEVPEWTLGLDGYETFYSFYGFWNYNYDNCYITYKSSNNSIFTVNNLGVARGNGLGNAKMSICVNERSSSRELDCFDWKVNVSYVPDSARAINDSQNLLNAINNYYWYLDGYEYAYIHPTVIPWVDHSALTWNTKYIELIDNELVTSEETNQYYFSSSNIHNTLLANPIEFAYKLIEDYNMRVINNKLYITFGDKTYSFTKYNSEKEMVKSFDLNNNNVEVNEGVHFQVIANVLPLYEHDDTLSFSNNNSEAISCGASSFWNTYTIDCTAIKAGSATLTLTNGDGVIKTVNVVVNHIPVYVTGVTLNKSHLDLIRGNNETLTAEVTPNNADDKTLEWSSSDTSVATVNSNGIVVAVGKGTAVITVTTNDGDFTDECTVTVDNPPLTGNVSIGYQLSFGQNFASAGISATLTGSGGTGVYTYYDIKLYTSDDTLIAETTNNSSNSIFAVGYNNGSYYATFEIRDSDGTTYSGTSGTTTISGF